MSDFNFEGFEPQNVEVDTEPKGSLSGDDLLLGLFGSRKSVSQGSNTPHKLSQQQNEHQLVIKKLSQVRVEEFQRTRTDELRRIHTGELEVEDDKNCQSSQKQKTVENPLTSNFANQKGYIGASKQTNAKKGLNEEEEKCKYFRRNLNKLALFAYEAEEGIDMLENGQNPFLEEVDRLLQEINSPEPFPTEVDQLFQ